MRNPLLLVLLSAAALVAQLPGQVILEQQASFENLGGGFADCRFSADGSRMLSRGPLGELVWWDTAKWTELRTLPAVAPYVTATALHPTEPWAVLGGSEGGWDGTVHVVDLETGGVRQVGDSYAVDLRFSGDGSRLAAIWRRGERNMLKLFDASSLRAGPLPDPERSLELRTLYFRHLVFGPEDAFLAVSTVSTYSGGSEYYRLDLRRQDSVLEPEDGSPVAFLSDGTPRECGMGLSREVWSGDGRWGARLVEKTLSYAVQCLGPEPGFVDLTPHMETWLSQVWVSPAGTIAVSDMQGQLHLPCPGRDEHRIVGGHRGSVMALAFSPDGTHLASMGEGAATVVDRTGRRVRTFRGTRTLLPGETGSEFLEIGPRGMRRWHAASDRFIGQEVAWEAPLRPKLLRSAPVRSLEQFHVGAPVLAHPGGLWFAENAERPYTAMSWSESGAPSPLALPEYQAAYYGMDVSDLLWDARRSQVLLAEYTPPLMCGTGFGQVKYWGSVRALSAEGRELAAEMMPASVLWMELAPDGDRVFAGLGDKTIRVFDPESLEPLQTVELPRGAMDFAFLDGQRALVLADNGQLYQVDVRALDVGKRVALPDGFGPVTAMKLSPDRETLALASHSDVRLFAVHD